MFEILKRIFIFSIIFLLPSVADAHGLYLSSEGGKLHANFSDHSPASGAVVTVVDEDGIVIVRDTMDEKGIWPLPKSPEGVPKFVIVEATGGHLTRIAWQEVLHGTSKGFFDYFSVRIAIGIAVLCGGGFFIKRLLNPKSKMSRSPPSTRIGTILILFVLIGLGLLDNLFYLLLCLLIISLFAVLAVRKAFVTVWRCKGIWIFFILTGVSLLWTEDGRTLAPILITRMFVMWLWVVVWIHWVGFEQILSTLERLGIPSILMHVIAFTARFLPILSERLKMMFAAQSSRGARKGVHPLRLRNLAGGIGCLLLASFEQAENVERAMQSRGFSGIFPFLVEDTVAVPCGSLIFLFTFLCIVWFGVVCDVLCYPCSESIFQISKWWAGAI